VDLEKLIEANKQIKDEPFISLPTQSYKVRRNALLCSVLCLYQTYGPNSLGGEFEIFKKTISLPGLWFNVALLGTTFYFGIYFAMLGWNAFQKWRQRSTGIENSQANMNTSTYDGGSKQQPVDQTTGFETIENVLQNWQKKIDKLPDEKTIMELKSIDPSNNHISNAKLDELIRACGNLNSMYDSFIKSDMQSKLVAFEKGFWKHQRKSYSTFFLLEFGGPLVLSLIAAAGLIYRIVSVYSQEGLYVNQIINLCS